MTAPIKLANTTEVVVKVVEINGYKPLGSTNVGGKKVVLSRGEARIFASRAEKKGISLDREVAQNQVVENFFATKKAVVTLDEGSKGHEPATHIAFVPVQRGMNEGETAYDADLHMAGIQEVLKQALNIEIAEGLRAKPSDITLRMTYPGTFEGRLAAQSRCEAMEQFLKNLGVNIQWQLASADLPQEERTSFTQTRPVDYGAFAGQAGDVMVNGSRDLRSARVTEALRTVGKLLIQGQKAKRLIVPLSIGANLTLAEAAVQSGVTVVLAFIGSQPETWTEANRERVNALVMNGAQIVGDQNVEWAQGLFSASIEDLAKRVVAGGGRVALMTPENNRGEGKSLEKLPGVVNFFPQVQNYLNAKLGEGVVEAELAKSNEKRELAAQAPAHNTQPAALSEIPF